MPNKSYLLYIIQYKEVLKITLISSEIIQSLNYNKETRSK